MTNVTKKEDPTNQARTRKKANADFKRRLNKSQREVIALFNDIPRKKTTQKVIPNQETQVVWEYDFDDGSLVVLRQNIEDILDNNLETREENIAIISLLTWWYSEYQETSWRSGAFNENNNINQLASLIAGVILLDEFQLTSNPRYISGLATEILSSFNSISGLSDFTAAQVYQQIVSGMQAGLTPKQITNDIVERFNVARSSAVRIVDTSINQTNNNARTMITILYRDEFGLNAAVLHISALIPTTRPHHAARHGFVFTPEQQTAWWNRGANRIRCHCSIRTVLLKDDGTVADSDFINQLIKERETFKP